MPIWKQHKDALDEDGQRRLYNNPLRVLDSKTPSMQAICDDAPRLIDHLGGASRRHYDDWRAMPAKRWALITWKTRVWCAAWILQSVGVPGGSPPNWAPQAHVAAAADYDSPIEQLGGKPAPAVNFAMGVERLMLLLQDKALLPAAPGPGRIWSTRGEGAALYALTVAQLRAGLKVIQHRGEAANRNSNRRGRQ